MYRDAEPQEFTLPRPRHRTFLGIDSQFQGVLEESPDPAHHPIGRYATAHINVAVIGVTTKRELPSFQLPIQIIKQNVGEQRGEYSPNAKGNFQFERVIGGWRALPLLDLRRKR